MMGIAERFDLALLSGTKFDVACCLFFKQRRTDDGYGNKRNRFPYRQR